MSSDLYVRNATVVTEAGRFHGGVVASGGRISQLGDRRSGHLGGADGRGRGQDGAAGDH